MELLTTAVQRRKQLQSHQARLILLTATKTTVPNLDSESTPKAELSTRQIHIEEAGYSNNEKTTDDEDYEWANSSTSGRFDDEPSPPPPNVGQLWSLQLADNHTSPLPQWMEQLPTDPRSPPNSLVGNLSTTVALAPTLEVLTSIDEVINLIVDKESPPQGTIQKEPNLRWSPPILP